MNRLFTSLGALAVVTAFLVWWFHPTQALKRRTKNLMETLTLVEGAGTASRNLKVGTISQAIAGEIELSGSGDRRAEGTFSRSQIESGFAWLTQGARSTRFELIGFDSVTINGDTGTVRARVDARVDLKQGESMNGPHRVTLVWHDDGQSWRLTRAEWVTE